MIGDPPRPVAVAAAAAARVRRARRLAAHADRHAGQRDRLERLGDDAGVGPLRVLRVRARRRPARGRDDRDRRALRRAAAAATATRAGDPARLQRARADARRAVRARRRPELARSRARRASPRWSSRRARSSSARRVFPGMVTDSGDLVVLAVQRHGEDARARRPRSPSATRCCCGGRGARSRRASSDPDVLVVDAPELVRRQAVPLGAGAKRALVVLAGMVVLLATGAVPPVGGRAARGRRDRAPAACSTWIRPTARSRGRRWCSWRA